MSSETKPCVKCGGTERYADGRCVACKKAYYAANRERVKAYSAANRDKIRGQQKEYRTTNYGRISDWQKNYYAANRERAFWQRVQRKYGLTQEQWWGLYHAQGGLCANINCDQVLVPNSPSTHVDHNHETNRVRGILCRECNISLGALREDPYRINGLNTYARKHHAIDYPEKK